MTSAISSYPGYIGGKIYRQYSGSFLGGFYDTQQYFNIFNQLYDLPSEYFSYEGYIFIYRVDWNLAMQILNPGDYKGSGFFGNPQRKKFGNISFNLGNYFTGFDNINYDHQVIKPGHFYYYVGCEEPGTAPLRATTNPPVNYQYISPDANEVNIFSQRYCDQVNWAFEFQVNLLYQAEFLMSLVAYETISLGAAAVYV